jgi:hypothetical protein
MQLIESHKDDVLVDRGRSTVKVQSALNMLTQTDIPFRQEMHFTIKYTINRAKYLQATYYANMSVHQLFHWVFRVSFAKVA